MPPPFGFSYDERMLLHDCPYDSTMAEKPERMKLIYERLVNEGLLVDVHQIPARPATDEELLLNHPPDLLRELEKLTTSEECEEYCKDKEILWLGPQSEAAARLAAGSTIDVVRASVEGKIKNGFAIVRPPGHHSYGKVPQGYCVFNNVAVAAKAAVEQMGVKKVAVIDFDYHPGNGTYYSLKDDDRFLFCSFHAYHHAAFWPFSTEFDYDTKGNQIFFPLNAAMNTEGDFLGAFHHVLLPMLKEWQPELILISAGFDAGYYDIMMEMGQAVKAHGYGHMTALLEEICPGRTVAVLEGGYFPLNYTEGATMMVKALQHRPLPHVPLPSRISAPLAETIWNNIIHHSKKYKSMEQHRQKLQEQQKKLGLPEFVVPPRLNLGLGVRELWDSVKKARAVRTREWFPEFDEKQTEFNNSKIKEYIQQYDYDTPTQRPTEEELLKQLVWDDRARADAFIKAAPSCLIFVQDFTDFVEGKKQNMMICDRTLYDEAKKDEKIQ